MNLLFLNSIGGLELIFIMLAVLMLFGSKSIPGIAKTLGRGMREIRTASDEIKRDIQNSALDMRKDLNIENPLNDVKKMIEEPSAPKDFKKDNPETSLEPPVNSQPISKTQPPKNEEQA